MIDSEDLRFFAIILLFVNFVLFALTMAAIYHTRRK